jgi:hypothetical protein
MQSVVTVAEHILLADAAAAVTDAVEASTKIPLEF